MVLAPVELGRIEGGHLHHRHANLAAVMQQFTAQRISESANREFCAAIRRLKRNCPIGECRPDLDDDAVILPFHAPEGGHCAVNRAQVGDFGRPFVIFGGNFAERRINCRHCVVDPHIEGPEGRFDRRRCGFDLCRVGHIGNAVLFKLAEAAIDEPDGVIKDMLNILFPIHNQVVT